MPTPPPVSLEDIARKAGVTRNTVSVALRNKPGVSEDTRKRIVQLAEEMGYRPNPMVTALMSRIRSSRPVQSHTNIAFIHSFIEENEWKNRPYYKRIYEGIERRCHQTGYSVTPYWLNRPDLTRDQFRRMLLARGTSGIIIGPVDLPRRHIHFNWDGFALAAIGLTLWRPSVHRVYNDMRQSMTMAVRELRKLQYHRIGIIYSQHTDRKYDFAWSSAIGGEFAKHPECLCSPCIGREDNPKGILDWIQREKPDVVVDATFKNLLALLKRQGFRVPEDIGYVNIPHSDSPSDIASVQRDMELLGANAVDLVSSQLMRNERGVPTSRLSVLVDSKWNQGETVRMQSR